MDRTPPAAIATPRSLPLAGFALRVVTVITLLALALLLWRTVDVILMIMGSVVVAVLLRALADPIGRRTGLSSNWTVPIATLLVVLALTAVFWFAGAEIRSQVADLAARLPEAWQALQDTLGSENLQRLMGDGSALASRGPGVLFSLAGFATTLGGVIVNLLLVLIGGVFLATAPAFYRDGLVRLLPGEEARQRLRDGLDTCGSALRLWLLGQLVSMAMVGVLIGTGLWLVGVPAPLALGALAALAEFVPIVGPIVSAIPGLLLGFAQGWTVTLWALLVYVVVQQIESNFITPLIQRRAVDLPPALTLFAVVAIGAVFGPLGLVLAAPILVVVFVLVKKLWIRDTLHERTDIPGEGT